MNKPKLVLILLAGWVLVSGIVVAQQYQERYRRYGRGFRYYRRIDYTIEPMWPANEQYKNDVFTFVRVRYTSFRNIYGQPQWSVDYPDSEMNLSMRLQELTALKVNPEPVIVDLHDPELLNYPFVYLIEPGYIRLTRPEVEGLRNYINRGGFVLVDDFWDIDEWRNFELEMKRVFPDRKIVDVPLSHEIFNNVYQLKTKPMIPSIGHYLRGRASDRWGVTHANYRAIEDDNGRIVMMICHNTDLGDGWEREGEDNGYFELYSEKYAYPLGINIVTYALTH